MFAWKPSLPCNFACAPEVSAGRGDIFRPVRTKDEVREEIWKSMEREGVSRFPGAEGRIPNFAGAKLAAEKLAGHRQIGRAHV